MPEERLRLLLVEDSPGDARLLQELVRDEPRITPEWVHVTRLVDGLAVLQEGGVDAVLLDLSLPDAQGLDSVSRVHAAAPGVPIVILTARVDEAIARAAIGQGAQDYLVKGRVDPHQLGQAILYAIARKRTEESARRLAGEQAARRQAELSERRSRLLAEASRLLVSSLDCDATLPDVALLAVPFLGDLCVIDLQEQGRIRRVAVAHADPGDAATADEVRRSPPDPAAVDDPIVAALRTGAPALLAFERGAAPVVVPVGRFAPSGALIAPLVASGRSVGALTFVSHGRPYGAEDLALAADLADRAALAVENARLHAELQRALRACEEVLAIVSHDLKSPLGVVLMGSTLLLETEHEGLSTEQVHNQAAMIQRAGERMKELIRDVLDAATIENGRLPILREGQPIAPILIEALDMLALLAAEKSIAIVRELDVEGAVVACDRARILQVLSNLLGNAIKFTPPEGTITVRARVVHAGDPEAGDGRGPGALHCSVTDTGPGIPAEQLARVFERYWQGKRSARSGVGLGLYIAKGVVEAHEGAIWAESAPGVGSTFHFKLPLAVG